jgi:hypothetical protein
MQHGGLAIIQRGQAAVDRWCQIIRLRDAFAMRAECLGHGGKIPLLALTARRQARLKLVGSAATPLG